MQSTNFDGTIIEQPGIYSGVSIDVYHGQPCDGPSVSSSGLRAIWNESPAHFWAKSSLNKSATQAPEKRHFSVGRLAHQLLLEGSATLHERFAIRPERWSDWRTKDAQVWRNDHLAAGFTVVTPEDFAVIAGMADSLRAHPLVDAGILDGDVERSMFARDPETGIWLKSRPDVIPNDSGDLVDLKTTISVSTEPLRRAISEHGYAQQAALAASVFEAATGVKMETFSFVWVEKAPPFCVRVTTLTAEDLLRGDMQNRAALRMLGHGLETGHWPGPGGNSGDAEFLSIPAWAAKTIDDRLEALMA